MTKNKIASMASQGSAIPTNEEILHETRWPGPYSTEETLGFMAQARAAGREEQRGEVLESFSVLADFYAQKGKNDVCDNIRREIEAIRAQGEEEK